MIHYNWNFKKKPRANTSTPAFFEKSGIAGPSGTSSAEDFCL